MLKVSGLQLNRMRSASNTEHGHFQGFQGLFVSLLVWQAIIHGGHGHLCQSSTLPDHLLIVCDNFDGVNAHAIESNQSIQLQITNNQIHLMPKLPVIPNLTVLILKNNAIYEIENEAFINLSQLEELDLSGNVISSKWLHLLFQ